MCELQIHNHVSSWKALAMVLPSTQLSVALGGGFSMTMKSACPKCRDDIDRGTDHRERRREHVCTEKCRKFGEQWFGIPRNVAKSKCGRWKWKRNILQVAYCERTAVRAADSHDRAYCCNTNCRCRPHSVFMCFVCIWEQTAIISLYSINWLVFITEI